MFWNKIFLQEFISLLKKKKIEQAVYKLKVGINKIINKNFC